MFLRLFRVTEVISAQHIKISTKPLYLQYMGFVLNLYEKGEQEKGFLLQRERNPPKRPEGLVVHLLYNRQSDKTPFKQ